MTYAGVCMAAQRKNRAAETEARLLESAAEVFAERGFDGTSLDEVAARAGVTKGALYHRYAGKHEVLLAALAERQRVRADGLAEIFATAGAHAARGGGRAALIARHLADVLGRDDTLDALLVEAVSLGRRDPSFRARLTVATRSLKAEIADLLEARARDLPTPPALAPEHLAAILSGLATGLAIERFSDPDGTPAGLLATAVARVLQ